MEDITIRPEEQKYQQLLFIVQPINHNIPLWWGAYCRVRFLCLLPVNPSSHKQVELK